jgi:hypothetical protein
MKELEGAVCDCNPMHVVNIARIGKWEGSDPFGVERLFVVFVEMLFA